MTQVLPYCRISGNASVYRGILSEKSIVPPSPGVRQTATLGQPSRLAQRRSRRRSDYKVYGLVSRDESRAGRVRRPEPKLHSFVTHRALPPRAGLAYLSCSCGRRTADIHVQTAFSTRPKRPSQRFRQNPFFRVIHCKC